MRLSAAYIAYGAWSNGHTITIEQLDATFTDSLGAAASTGPISPTNNEAPVLFQRGNWTYLLFGATCCFCREGAGSQVWAALHPMGPWTNTGVELNPGSPRNIPSQDNFVFQFGNTYVWTADRWASSPDGMKSHDFQYWAPLRWNDTVHGPPVPVELVWQDWFIL